VRSLWRRLIFFAQAGTLLRRVLLPIALSAGGGLLTIAAVRLLIILTSGDSDPDAFTIAFSPLGGSGRTIGEGLARGLFKGACPAFLALIPLSLRLLRQYRVRGRVQSVQQALDDLQYPKDKYVLLLRPFGADGFIHVPEPRYAGQKKGWWRESSTVEAVLGRITDAMLGLPTLALVAPRQVVLPPGPRYLRASGDWKGDVEQLLQRALFVVVVFPPGKTFTQSVKWEIEQCQRLGLFGRLLLVVPPLHMAGRKTSRQALQEAAPSLATAPQGVLAAFLEPDGQARYWHAPAGAKVTSEDYASIFCEALRLRPVTPLRPEAPPARGADPRPAAAPYSGPFPPPLPPRAGARSR